MKKFKKIDRIAAKAIRELLNDNLAAIRETTDLHVEVGNINFDPDNGHLTAKVEVSLRSDDGTVMTKEASDFVRYTEVDQWEGIAATDLWRHVNITGRRIQIIGAKPRSRKYPILGRQDDGKIFKFTATSIAYAIERANKKAQEKVASAA